MLAFLLNLYLYIISIFILFIDFTERFRGSGGKKYRQGISFIPHGNQTQSCLHNYIEAKSPNVNARVAVWQSCPKAQNKTRRIFIMK